MTIVGLYDGDAGKVEMSENGVLGMRLFRCVGCFPSLFCLFSSTIPPFHVLNAWRCCIACGCHSGGFWCFCVGYIRVFFLGVKSRHVGVCTLLACRDAIETKSAFTWFLRI